MRSLAVPIRQSKPCHCHLIPARLRARVDRAVAEVGTLWGGGIAGQKADEGEIRKLTTSFILFFDQDFRSSDTHWDWHSIQQDCPTFFEWLILATADTDASVGRS